MKDVNIPFSLYDFFAILFPGFFGMIGIYLFFDPSLQDGINLLKSLDSVNEIVLLLATILVSYFVGHLFNTVAEFFIDRPANMLIGWSVNQYLTNLDILADMGIRGFVIKNGRLKFPKRIYEYRLDKPKNSIGSLLKSCVENTFGKINQDYGYTFTVIRAYVTQNIPDAANEAKVFAATSAMYQSLTLTFVLIGLAIVNGILDKRVESHVLTPVIVALSILPILCFNSYRRYKRMWVTTIYTSFMAATKTKQIASGKGS